MSESEREGGRTSQLHLRECFVGEESKAPHFMTRCYADVCIILYVYVRKRLPYTVHRMSEHDYAGFASIRN